MDLKLTCLNLPDGQLVGIQTNHERCPMEINRVVGGGILNN